VLGLKFPDDDIASLRFIAFGCYEGIDGVSYPCTASPSPMACISAPTNRPFHILFLPAYKIPTTLIEKTPVGIVSQYYPNHIKIGEVSFNLLEAPKLIHASGEFTEKEIEDAFGDANTECLYNCPWGRYYVERPDLHGRDGRDGKDVLVDMNVVFPSF
jgi:hypothetical protein